MNPTRDPRMTIHSPYRVGDEVIIHGRYPGKVIALVLMPWVLIKVRYEVTDPLGRTSAYEGDFHALDLEITHEVPDPIVRPADLIGPGDGGGTP